MKDYLAEDFVMGKLAAERGYGVILSSYVIEHRIGAQTVRRQPAAPAALEPQHAPFAPVGLRRPDLHPSPAAGSAVVRRAAPWWPVLAPTVVFRAAAAWATAVYVLRDPLDSPPAWWLVPLQDTASFLVWLAGFFGNTILWRGRKYNLQADGRFELVPSSRRR